MLENAPGAASRTLVVAFLGHHAYQTTSSQFTDSTLKEFALDAALNVSCASTFDTMQASIGFAASWTSFLSFLRGA